MAFDVYLFQFINQFAGKWFWLDNLAVFFARYFEFFLVLFLLLLLAQNFKKYWRMVVESLGAAFFSRFIITDLIRWVWQRPRPFALQNFAEQNLGGQVNLLFDYSSSAASFPSGHASFYFALAFVVYVYNKKLGTFFLVSAFLISLARVFSGIHWPTDILAGAAIGVLAAWVVFKFFRKT